MSEVYMDNTNFTGSETPENPNEYKKGLSVTAFVLSLVNLLCCCSFVYAVSPIGYIFVVPAIILAIISLATKRGGKGLAIAALIIAGISLVFMIAISVVFKEPAQDIVKLSQNADQYIQMWEETGEVPEEFQKYRDPKYDDIWKNMTPPMKNFDEFYDYLIKTLKQQRGQAATGTAAPAGEVSAEPLLAVG